MPLLSKRRSMLDIFNAQEDNRPKTGPFVPNGRSPSPTRPASEYRFPRSSLSHEVRPEDVPDAAGGQDGVSVRSKRFSLMKWRNLSESHLAVRAKEAEKVQKEDIPPLPPMPSAHAVPSIVKTAPIMDNGEPQQEQDEEDGRDRKVRPSLLRRSISKGRSPSKRVGRESPRKSMDDKRSEKKPSSLRWRRLQGRSTGLEDLQKLANAQVANNHSALPSAPPSYGDESSSALALPLSGDVRLSESSRSDGSNGSTDQIYGSTITTTHTVSTHTTFFKLPRRNKARNSLFPLPIKIPPPNEDPSEHRDEPTTPRASTGAISTQSLGASPSGKSASESALQRRHTETDSTQPPLPNNAALPKQSLSFAQPGVNLGRSDSQRSRASSNASPLHPPERLGMRDRASTNSSHGRTSHELGTPPPLSGSGRNSTSTTGRSSLGGLLNLSRFRQSSEPHSPRHGSPGTGSKSNSFAISREALVVPEREEGDTPGKYLERLEAAVARSAIAGILSKSADPFAQAVLRSYTRRFPFFGEPIDMSLRKFLLEAELPKETQQVDRVIQAFADRYHECNPGIFVAPDQAYIIAFSLMMLHTDAFNKNNKRKMQKQDYIKNTSGQSVSDDVLGCFYDNICYTPFVHYEEEVDINGERVLPFKPKKSKLKGAIPDTGKKPSGPVDPYILLLDQKLDVVRPAIRDSITMEDPYNYRANDKELDPNYLQRAFTHTGVLQIISQRSRPTAYEGQMNNTEPTNPMEMQPGIIDIKISKVGTLWRKAAKKKKARSPWQEWGAILTGSQLYLFKNAHWAKGLMHQFIAAQRPGQLRTPVVFKPPLQEFKPDALIKTDHAVSLVDATYTRHKNAFTFVRPGSQEEVLLADNESELNDWLALINYAAAFRAAGVRIRGMVGGAEEDVRSRDVHRLDSTQSSRTTQTTETASSAVGNRGLSVQLQRQVMAARKQIMAQKIAEMNKEVTETNKDLDRMLRNARHLLILAPVAPRTREDIIHAAAQADASITWTRRDIWRLKCHKDILSMDVQQEAVTGSEIERLAEQQAIEAPETAKKARIRGLSRLNSKASAPRSPPQSPTSPNKTKRQSNTASAEAYVNDDVFITPPQSATHQRTSEEWHIPPFQLDVLREEHDQQQLQQQRSSVTSTVLSTSSQGGRSVSHASTTSSTQPAERHASDEPSEIARGDVTPSASMEDSRAEMLARQTIPPEKVEPVTSRNQNMDGGQPITTPDNKQRNGVRRSLQKTLRDSHHHTGSSHKHKRGKESDSTIRSGGREAEKPEEVEEGTPCLKREKGRFILHGKQASVVQFGNDWPDERMKMRREAWRQNSTSPREEKQPQRGFSFRDYGWRPAATSPVVRDLTRDADESQDEDGSILGKSGADAFATSASPANISSSTSITEDPRGEPASYFDITDFETPRQDYKRETVLGPTKQRKHSLQKGEDGTVVSDEESLEPSDVDTGNGKRTTVIGPSTQTIAAQAGAEASDDESEHDFGHISPRTVEVA